MIEQLCRRYGLYLLMLLAVLCFQILFTYGGLETAREINQDGGEPKIGAEANLFTKFVSAPGTTHLPMAFFALAAGFVLMLGAGLAVDVVLLMKWLLASSRGEMECSMAWASSWTSSHGIPMILTR